MMTHVSMTDFQTDPAPSTVSQADLQALIVARLCHDLASPLGAITNGVELLEMVQAGSPEVALVAQSARQATARLRLFRLAFGHTGTDQMTGAAEMSSLLRAHSETARARMAWGISSDIPRSHAKFLILGLMCLETVIPWGGEIRLDKASEAYKICAEGQRMRVETELWEKLAKADQPLTVTPANVQFEEFRQTLNRFGFGLTLRHDDTTLTLVLTQKCTGK
ncbi:MAG: histidine phosphotransferase family protein [Roseinatronobacter sp.]